MTVFCIVGCLYTLKNIYIIHINFINCVQVHFIKFNIIIDVTILHQSDPF